MAWDATDWTITRGAGVLDVRYIGDDHGGTAPTYVTTIQLHRALQDFADDEVDSGDDELSIIDQTPSDRGGADTNITLLNGCNLDDASAQFVYDGSITQDGGDTIYDGIQVFGNATVIQVIQDGARIDDDFWNYPKMITAVEDTASGTTHRFTLKVRENGSDIDGRRLLGTQRELGTLYTEFFIGGGTNRGNNVLALKADSNLNNQTAEGTIAGWDTIVNDVEGYTPITVGGTAFNFYSDWELGSQGKNDFYERAQWIQTRVGTIGGTGDTRDADQILYGLQGDVFRGVTHAITVDTPTGTLVEPEAISWSGSTAAITAFADAGDSLKVTVTSATHGLLDSAIVVITGTTNYNGTFSISNVTTNTFDIVDTWVADDATGTWTDQLGTGQLLATDSTTAATEIWIQLLTGTAPADTNTITGAGGGTVDVATTITAKTVSLPFIGATTGTAIIGSFGLGIGADDLTQNETLFDLDGNTVNPPNNVTFTVNNVKEDDYVIVANDNGGDFDFAQRVTNAAYTTGAVTSFVTTVAIPTDIPTSGTFRIELDTGAYKRIAYTSFAGSTFTTAPIDMTGVNAAASGNNLFVTYIDKVVTSGEEGLGYVDTTFVYSSTRTLFVRARNAGTGVNTAIKTAETTASVGTGGGAATLTRIDDF
jgi:hypothetical protein